MLGSLFAAVLAAAAPVTFAAPAGALPASHLRGAPFDAVLPSGRIVTPAGTSVVTGMNALGFALSPDGRYAVVSNDDEREGRVHSLLDPSNTGGYTLSVVDLATMRVVDRYADPDENEKYWVGIVALPDPRQPSRTLVLASGGPANVVYAFDLDAKGHLTPDATHLIPTPGPIDPLFADEGHSFPGTIVLSPDKRRAYVVNEAAGSVSTIDTATRGLTGPTVRVGDFPFGAALVGNRLLVSNEGLMRYGVLPKPLDAPPFRTPPDDPVHASSLSFVGVGAGGELNAAPLADGPPNAALSLDRMPDGKAIVGGAHPGAIVATPDGAYAYVAMANVDRIATVALAGGTPRVVGGTELRLFDRGPYGTQPAALALSHDGSRLYVALAGLNAVAVIDARDPAHLHRLGLIPAGWYPTALALAADDRTLLVANTKGFGHEAGFNGDPATDADANAVWSTLQKIDLGSIRLADATMVTLKNARRVATRPAYPAALTHVVVILEENKTFDAMLGDLGAPYGDPRFVQFGRTVTPNLHALARRYTVATNVFADAEESDAGHQFFAGGIATLYSERTTFVRGGRRPLVNKNEDPEDYPRLGYVFNALARRAIPFRDYGDLVRLSGYDEGADRDPKIDDPASGDGDDRTSLTKGLGGLYSLDVPAPAALAGHVDLDYPGWNLRIRDERRAREFVRDYEALARTGREPRYTYVWLPNDHGGFGRGIPPFAEEVADGDRALGIVVSHLTRLPSWKHTAIFIMPDDAQSTRDHVDEYRTYAVVVSPYAKRAHAVTDHLSTVSVLKTSEQILGLPPLSLGDVLATDMRDAFTTVPDVRPFNALPVATQTASRAGARIAALMAQLDQSTADADTARGGRLVALARRADALSARRATMTPAVYAAAQARLWERALDTVATNAPRS